MRLIALAWLAVTLSGCLATVHSDRCLDDPYAAGCRGGYYRRPHYYEAPRYHPRPHRHHHHHYDPYYR